jgi:hypothetical protein
MSALWLIPAVLVGFAAGVVVVLHVIGSLIFSPFR